MTSEDEWGRDPSVRAMRGLFGRMESRQRELLDHLAISPFDGRLRSAREEARALFEQMLHHPDRSVGRGGKDPAELYIRCLIQAMKRRGLPAPAKTDWEG